LARAHLAIDQIDDARRCIAEALMIMQTTKQAWPAAELHRTTGDIAWLSPEHDAATAQACFEQALAVAREQQAHDLLAPVYGWFTQGSPLKRQIGVIPSARLAFRVSFQ
jgi:hypothetical protein